MTSTKNNSNYNFWSHPNTQSPITETIYTHTHTHAKYTYNVRVLASIHLQDQGITKKKHINTDEESKRRNWEQINSTVGVGVVPGVILNKLNHALQKKHEEAEQCYCKQKCCCSSVWFNYVQASTKPDQKTEWTIQSASHEHWLLDLEKCTEYKEKNPE